jgi:hypothetical protein
MSGIDDDATTYRHLLAATACFSAADSGQGALRDGGREGGGAARRAGVSF